MNANSIIVLGLVSTFLSFSNGCGDNPQKQPDLAQTSHHKVIAIEKLTDLGNNQSSVNMTITGISCIRCQGVIALKLKKNPQVISVTFEEKEVAKVTYFSGQVTIAELSKIIEDIG